MVNRNPAADAQEVLAKYWADSGGNLRFPVDPIHIARVMGANVYLDWLGKGVSGQLEVNNDIQTILLSIDNGPLRQRFTCAHEVGHLVDRRKYGGPDRFIDYRDDRAGTGTNPNEVYANQFAAELLMPRKEVARLAREENWSTESMARRFGVSPTAMAIRRDNLRLNS